VTAIFKRDNKIGHASSSDGLQLYPKAQHLGLTEDGAGLWIEGVLTPDLQPDLSQLRHIFQAQKHRCGYTYDGLARATGLARQTLININSGNFYGDIRTWLLLSKAFGTDLETLLRPVWGAHEDGAK
jgi:DNA-binding XRE family transcriptional regulator